MKVCVLVLFCAVYVAWGLTDSIQAPFYPIVAESKGASVGEYGSVFGVIHLAIFVSGPIFGKYMQHLGRDETSSSNERKSLGRNLYPVFLEALTPFLPFKCKIFLLIFLEAVQCMKGDSTEH